MLWRYVHTVDGPHDRHRDVPFRGCRYEAAYVSSWLEADIQRLAVRGPLSAQKQTLKTLHRGTRRSASAYRSKADVNVLKFRRRAISEGSRYRSGYRSEADIVYEIA